ncbi:MAG: hypothetical protein HQ507_10760 [Candidatus Marinimicrobia bacterium]|nr:hypothetical protein [Candidatus Neomarinimicrobiota bacterium]
MKTMIAIITLSTGLLLGCQDKTADQGKDQTIMKHDKQNEMSHANHDHSKMNMSSDSKMDQGQMNSTESIVYYTCPMESHKHVHSQNPGDCPECGMTLVPVVETATVEADFYGCPMPEHSHVRADAAGKCPECGMQLKPMKIGS